MIFGDLLGGSLVVFTGVAVVEAGVGCPFGFPLFPASGLHQYDHA